MHFALLICVAAAASMAREALLGMAANFKLSQSGSVPSIEGCLEINQHLESMRSNLSIGSLANFAFWNLNELSEALKPQNVKRVPEILQNMSHSINHQHFMPVVSAISTHMDAIDKIMQDAQKRDSNVPVGKVLTALAVASQASIEFKKIKESQMQAASLTADLGKHWFPLHDPFHGRMNIITETHKNNTVEIQKALLQKVKAAFVEIPLSSVFEDGAVHFFRVFLEYCDLTMRTPQAYLSLINLSNACNHQLRLSIGQPHTVSLFKSLLSLASDN